MEFSICSVSAFDFVFVLVRKLWIETMSIIDLWPRTDWRVNIVHVQHVQSYLSGRILYDGASCVITTANFSWSHSRPIHRQMSRSMNVIFLQIEPLLSHLLFPSFAPCGDGTHSSIRCSNLSHVVTVYVCVGWAALNRATDDFVHSSKTEIRIRSRVIATMRERNHFRCSLTWQSAKMKKGKFSSVFH